MFTKIYECGKYVYVVGCNMVRAFIAKKIEIRCDCV